jgi:hypothetical protein
MAFCYVPAEYLLSGTFALKFKRQLTLGEIYFSNPEMFEPISICSDKYLLVSL